MSDEEEKEVVKRVSDVIGDLWAGKVPRTARRDLGQALDRADRDADIHRAIANGDARVRRMASVPRRIPIWTSPISPLMRRKQFINVTIGSESLEIGCRPRSLC